jgi:nucleoside-diphosphate-sugar epimerase
VNILITGSKGFVGRNLVALAETIQSFRDVRTSLFLPDIEERFRGFMQIVKVIDILHNY